MKPKKVPMRMCVGCGEMKDKKQVLRVVKNKDGVISLDTTGKAQGRGAYLCADPECFKKARKNRRLERGLGMAIPDEVYEKIEAELKSQSEK